MATVLQNTNNDISQTKKYPGRSAKVLGGRNSGRRAATMTRYQAALLKNKTTDENEESVDEGNVYEQESRNVSVQEIFNNQPDEEDTTDSNVSDVEDVVTNDTSNQPSTTKPLPIPKSNRNTVRGSTRNAGRNRTTGVKSEDHISTIVNDESRKQAIETSKISLQLQELVDALDNINRRLDNENSSLRIENIEKQLQNMSETAQHISDVDSDASRLMFNDLNSRISSIDERINSVDGYISSFDDRIKNVEEKPCEVANTEPQTITKTILVQSEGDVPDELNERLIEIENKLHEMERRSAEIEGTLSLYSGIGGLIYENQSGKKVSTYFEGVCANINIPINHTDKTEIVMFESYNAGVSIFNVKITRPGSRKHMETFAYVINDIVYLLKQSHITEDLDTSKLDILDLSTNGCKFGEIYDHFKIKDSNRDGYLRFELTQFF